MRKYYSIFLIILFFFPLISLHFQGPILQNALFKQKHEDNLDDDRADDIIHSKFSLTRGSDPSPRSPDSESEPNNDVVSAVNNLNELKDNTEMNGQLTYSIDEVDFFYIDLNGGGQNLIDRVNVTPTFSNISEINDKAVGIHIKAYTEFSSELSLLEYKAFGTDWAVINDSSLKWRNSTSVIFNADRTGRYYLELTAGYIKDLGSGQVIDPDVQINYSLSVTVTSITNLDKNNDPNNGTVLSGALQDLDITQADDHWDWYRINSLTENRANNVSINIKINDAFETNTHEGYYVKVTGILKCIDLDSSSEVKYISHGDKEPRIQNPILLNITARFTTAYLGIHSQQLMNIGGDTFIPDFVDCGASTVQYDIDTFEIHLVNNPPVLSLWNISLLKGSVQDSFIFDILYQDLDNDEPFFVNVTIDDLNFTMLKSTIPANDGDYTNGERYEVTVSGSNFINMSHYFYKSLEVYFSAQDFYPEISMPIQYVDIQPGVKIKVIDNVRPAVRTGLPETWSILEDTEVAYINLFTIFKDPDKDKYPNEVTFKVWDEDNLIWKKGAGTVNIFASILENNSIKLIPTHNKFGLDSIKILAYDNEFDLEGESAATQYILKVDIKPTNDKPVLFQPIDYIVENGTEMKEDEYVNITFIASDITDKHSDPIIYSTDILDKIPELGANPKKYEYKFSSSTGNLSFLPGNELVGEYIIEATATDNGTIAPIGLADTKQFILQIINQNDAPIAKITHPEDNTRFNTSSNITLNAEGSVDVDYPYGDRLEYYWYLNNMTEDDLLVFRTKPIETIPPIKVSGKHEIILKVVDGSDAWDTDSISIWVLSLVGDIVGNDDWDEDGMPDAWELKYGFNNSIDDSELDPDSDNFNNLQEYLGLDGVPGGGDSSDPLKFRSVPGDIDGDEMPDSWELEMFENLNQDKDGDPDGDQYTNYEEYLGDSDPLITEDVPKQTIDKKKGSQIDLTRFLLPVFAIVVVIIILVLLTKVFLKKRKERAEEAELEKAGKKKPLYTPEPMPIHRITPPALGGPLPVAQPMQAPMQPQIPSGQPQPIQVTSPGIQVQPQQTIPVPPQPKPQQGPTPTPPAPGQTQEPLGLPPTGQVIQKVDEKTEKE